MKQYEFILVFKLANKGQDPREYAEQMQTCANAKPCFGVRGYIVVEFKRNAYTLRDAKNMASREILHMIPAASVDYSLADRNDHI